MLRYLDYDDNDDGFTMVVEKSYIHGIIDSSAPNEVRWTIHIEWHNPDVEPWEFRKAWAEIGGLLFKERNWKDLVGRETQTTYEREDVYPVMPGNPANLFYYSKHVAPIENHVKITARMGPDLSVEWRGMVDEHNTSPEPFEIIETVPFKNIFIVFKDAASVDKTAALKLARRVVDRNELGEPFVTGVNHNWIGIPIQVARETQTLPPLPKPRKKRPTEHDPAVIALKDLGAEVKRDTKNLAHPVVSIDLSAGVDADEAIALIKSIADLGELSLRTDGITDKGAARLAGLQQLRNLSLVNSSLTEAGLAHLQGLCELHSLHITGSPIGDRGFEFLKQMTALQMLDLYNSRLSDHGLSTLINLTELRRLTITGQEISDAGLVHLRNLTKLEYLNLQSTNVCGEGLVHLAALHELKHLNIMGGPFSDAGLTVVANFKQLERLGIPGTAVTDAGLLYLKGLTKLRLLLLNNTKATKDGAAALRKFLRKLEIMPWWYP